YNVMGGGEATPNEGAQVVGDSGGGLFLTVSGTTYLAGVTSFVTPLSDTPIPHVGSTRGYYGDVNGYTRVSPYLSFITETIPEPGTAGAALGMLGVVLSRRSRRGRP